MSNPRTMNCEATRDLLPVYDDGALESAQATALAAHLAECPACCGELAAWRQLSDYVHRHGQPGGHPLSAARRDQIVAVAAALPPRPTVLRWLAPRLAAAGLGALLASAGWMVAERVAQSPALPTFDGPLAQYLDAAQAGRSPAQIADLRRLESSPTGRFLALTRTAATRGESK